MDNKNIRNELKITSTTNVSAETIQRQKEQTNKKEQQYHNYMQLL